MLDKFRQIDEWTNKQSCTTVSRESLSQWKNTRNYNEQTEDEAKFYSGGSVTAVIVVTAHHTS